MIALDTNAVMEILAARKRQGNIQAAIAHHSSKNDLALSSLTVSNLFYLAEKHKIPMARTEILISSYKFYDVQARDVIWALKQYGGKDFEDALQVAAALREGCKTFITIDKKLATKYGKYLNIQLIQ
jgi:predicted nucleic-acid-binding protein